MKERPKRRRKKPDSGGHRTTGNSPPRRPRAGTSARRDAEEAARREQNFRETIEDSLLVGLVAVDQDGRILSVNDAFCAMTGWRREELLGTAPPHGFWAPEEIKAIAAARKTLGRNLPLAGQEFVLRRRSGQRFPALVHASPFRDPDGSLKGYVGSVTDLTERKEAETEYRTILKTAMDGFWVSDHGGRFVDVNDAACRHLGYSREEFLGGMRIREIEAVESPEETAAHIRRIREEGHDRFETRHRRKDGAVVDTEVSAHYSDTGGGRYFVFIRDITERKRGEEALERAHADLERKVRERTAELQASNELLRKAQRQQRALLDAIPDIAWLKDREGRLIAVNQSYGRACGVHPRDLIGRTDLDVWPRQLAERYMADDRQVVKSGRMKRLEEPMLGRHGEEAWADTFKVPFFSEEGEVIGTVGIARDVTDRHRAEEALKESEAKYRALAGEFRALLDAIPDMVYFKDTEGRHRFVNRAFERMMGTSQDEVAGKTCDDLMSPGLAEYCRRSDDAVYEARRVVRSEEEMPGPDGTPFSLETIKAPFFDERGEIAGLVGLTRDITQRKRNEAELSAYRERLEAMVEERAEALQESEERFRSLVENSLVGFFIVQEDRVVFLNSAQERIFGPVRVPLPLEELEDNLHPEDVKKFRECRDALQGGLAAGREVEIRFAPKGAERGGRALRWVHCRMAPVAYRGKEALLVNMVDITQQREMERIALSQERMAALGHMAAGVAHEVRNPLSGINISISSIVNTVARSDELEPELRETIRLVVEQMTSAAGKIGLVVQRIMDFSRPTPPTMAPVSVNGCIRETLHLATVTLRKAGIRLNEVLVSGLPKVRGDACLLERVLLNLLTNAAQAMEGMDREKRIEVASAVADGRVTISVADSGPGVPEELRETIFDPFFTTKKEGTGIGLALSHRIVSDHGGVLTVGTSRFGGALFTIGLPAGEARTLPAV